MSNYSRIETLISDTLLVTALNHDIRYPTFLCSDPKDGRYANKKEIQKMKNDEVIFLRQVPISTITHFSKKPLPKAKAINVLNEVSNYLDVDIQEIDFPKEENLSLDLVSVHKIGKKYLFRVVEADGYHHAQKSENPQQCVNDTVKDNVLRTLGIDFRRVSEGILDCTNWQENVQNVVDWLMKV